MQSNLQFRVPVDDTHTLHFRYEYRRLAEGESPPSGIEFEDMPLYFADGTLKRDYVMGQDISAWVMQGPVSDRTTEHLGVSDVGIIMYRRLLDRQARIVEDGGEPMNVRRDPERNETIVLPIEGFRYPGYEGTGGPFRDAAPREPDVEAVLSGEGARRPEWDALGP